ncbi:hypothetical protein ACLB2K_035772 [Fragaria x ananassa]
MRKSASSPASQAMEQCVVAGKPRGGAPISNSKHLHHAVSVQHAFAGEPICRRLKEKIRSPSSRAPSRSDLLQAVGVRAGRTLMDLLKSRPDLVEIHRRTSGHLLSTELRREVEELRREVEVLRREVEIHGLCIPIWCF